MCGIVGYVGERPCRDLLVAGLEKLEYRGYDSAGISVIEDAPGRERARRRQSRQPARRGRTSRPRAAAASPWLLRSPLPASPTPAGPPTAASPRRTPTRTATAPTASTSSSTGSSRTTPSCARELAGEGHTFSSETDAEIVAHLIERHYDGDLAAAVRAAFAELRGHYAFVAMHADEPDRLVGARKECPLVAGVGEGETFLASAIPAFLAETREAVSIENDEIVTIDAAGIGDHRRRRQPGRACRRRDLLGRGRGREGRL